ncbi:hypothetical protein HGM15179_020280 [Zosterops borbonicus]|uniref:Reverse transcriptase domain-containing protein n=1 Tax=Zosterops borbonicus TaxID=364589 RepID=A0A8K1D780_9PASS|nr:hypothetical protein HGM15179_020280 [Zosterops borbonicus]
MALEELVEEQLRKGNIEETTSPWNSQVFVIQEADKTKWRLLQDLRQINVIEEMGSLQPGMPSPTMLPQNWNLAVIDIKDCFFHIPLHPDDAPRFAFSIPNINREAPRKRYHWRVLPQGMKNSRVICQCCRSCPTEIVHLRALSLSHVFQIAVVLGLFGCTIPWIVPQPKANVWRTLAKAMGQDHICLSQGSAEDPISSWLVGIPFKEAEYPPTLLNFKDKYSRRTPGRQSRALEEFCLRRKIKLPVINPLVLWRDWVSISLPRAESEPQELELLGSSPAPFCMFIPPQGQEKTFSQVLQIKDVYLANTWCDTIAHVKMASTPSSVPLSLPKGTFLICSDRAFAGIPSRLTGGPCTLGKLGLLSPNKTQIMDWFVKNSSMYAPVQKRDLADSDPDCESEIIHWSKAKATAITVFLPWVSVAKSMGELGQLECWVAKQANLTLNALSDLLRDEEVTRQATIQNRAAIDYLLFLHHHTCEEFEGLCCFNLSSQAEDVHQSIKKIRDMVHNIKEETKDWFDNIFGNWGLTAFGLIKKSTSRLIANVTSKLRVNNIWMTSHSPEKIEMQDLPPEEEDEEELSFEDFVPKAEGQWPVPFEEWPTNQQWFGDLYPESECHAPQAQFHSF